MFNRHQAEITVMQFTGYSLPVHQSMSVPWEFFSSSHFVSQFPPTRFPLLTAIGMCHFLPVHHLGMAFLPGFEGQNITHVVHPYSSIDTIAAWKKLRFILSVRSDFHMTDSLLIAVYAFVSRVCRCLSRSMRHCFLSR